jgi:predicted Holliday junction resolvase-like endonuclease
MTNLANFEPYSDIFLIYSFILLSGVIAGGMISCFILRRLLERKIQSEYEQVFKRRIFDAEKRIRHDSLCKSRAVLKGRIGEQLAPLLPNFRHNPADARFIGSPVDYIIFEGYSEAKEGIGDIRKIVFVDVKTGDAKLSPIQKKVKDAVANSAVEWETLVLDEQIF